MSHMTEHVGRVLGGRYRLLSPLGSGASADVYLGDDVRLHRRVAIKVLRAALASDEAFLRRFRAEARAAAALSHPNLLAVYDWDGEDPPYLITEYLKGGSLRAMLDAGHRLSPSQALVVGLQAAQGLDVAHRQGFVHRDIKPANLLFGGDGRLRVADFGLARAVAEASMTEPTGAVLGTARYASPEQAQGEVLTGQSDVYALGLVMIEAVTGKVPFAADTTVGTLTARLDKPVEVADELGALKPVLARAGSVVPSERPDAAELVAELMEAATELPRPASLPLVGQHALRQGPSPDTDRTTVAPAVAPAPAIAAAPPAAGPPDAGGPAGASATVQQPVIPPPAEPGAPLPPGPGVQPYPGSPGAGDAAPAHLARSDGGPPEPGASGGHHLAGPPKRSGKRRRFPGWVVPTLLTALALAVGAGGAWFLRDASVPSHTVPDSLIGAEHTDLDSLIGDRAWSREVQWVYSDEVDADLIMRTDPEPGSELREGETLMVVVSCGPVPVELPSDLEEQPFRDVTQQLEDLGFEVDVEREFHDEVAEDDVIALETGDYTVEEKCESDDEVPEDGLPEGSTVVLSVSDGPELPTVPTVEGMTWDEAETALEEAGFDPQRRRENSSSVQQGRVIRTDPPGGTRLAEDSEVIVWMSRGGEDDDEDDDEDRVAVPSLLGLNVDEAEEALEDVGLELGDVHGDDGDGDRVISQNPGPFGQVEEGAEVEVWTF